MQNEYKLAVRKNSNHHQWEIWEGICSREAELKEIWPLLRGAVWGGLLWHSAGVLPCVPQALGRAAHPWEETNSFPIPVTKPFQLSHLLGLGFAAFPELLLSLQLNRSPQSCPLSFKLLRSSCSVPTMISSASALVLHNRACLASFYPQSWLAECWLRDLCPKMCCGTWEMSSCWQALLDGDRNDRKELWMWGSRYHSSLMVLLKLDCLQGLVLFWQFSPE